jgi:hypothetical protein
MMGTLQVVDYSAQIVTLESMEESDGGNKSPSSSSVLAAANLERIARKASGFGPSRGGL